MDVIYNTLTDTCPIVVHNPFEFRDWNRIVEIALNAPPCKDEPQLTILTFNNQTETNLLQRNLERLNIKHRVLGRHIAKWSNLHKVDLAFEALETVDTPYLMACDGSDVCFLASPSEILHRFVRTGAQMLFNATYVNWPPDQTYATIEMKLHPDRAFCFLNGGVWIAHAESAKKVLHLTRELRKDIEYKRKLEDLCRNRRPSHKELFRNSEQVSIRPIYHKCFPEVNIDSRCEIFQVLQDEPKKWKKHAFDVEQAVRIRA